MNLSVPVVDVLSDEAILVEHARDGDTGAFGELVRIHHQKVIDLVFRMYGDISLAEDVAQETFIRAWQKLPSYEPRSSFRNWLYRIAANLAVDSLRREVGKSESLDETLHTSEKKPETVVAEAEVSEQVQRAILALPPASRIVLVLRVYEDLSYQEISSTLDIPVGTVMSRLNYARTSLRQMLKETLLKTEDVFYE